MTPGRRVTIGVTINLDNYENVRLEVEDVCPTLAEVDDLKAYLDGILAGLGRSEENTGARSTIRARLPVPAKDPTTRVRSPPPRRPHRQGRPLPRKRSRRTGRKPNPRTGTPGGDTRAHRPGGRGLSGQDGES